MTKHIDKDATKRLPVAFGQSGAFEVGDQAAAAQKFEIQINGLLEALENARHLTEHGVELWYARDLAVVLAYANWQNFRKVIEKAWVSCRDGGVDPAGHFVRADGNAPWTPSEVFTEASKNLKGGRPSENIILSRRAAYLIAENGDPSKLTVAVAQRYFTEQTRRQEIADQSVEALTEDQRRILIRNEVSEQNKGLAAAAYASGVRTNLDFAVFQTEGYKGMYGLRVDGIKLAKGIGDREQILDRMGSAELAANLFRLTQAEERLRKGDINTRVAANRTHHQIGRKVRQTMIDISGTPPEALPAADHIKHARKRLEAAGGASDTPKAVVAKRKRADPQ
jgi:DNA-damage-inducible protein D